MHASHGNDVLHFYWAWEGVPTFFHSGLKDVYSYIDFLCIAPRKLVCVEKIVNVFVCSAMKVNTSTNIDF